MNIVELDKKTKIQQNDKNTKRQKDTQTVRNTDSKILSTQAHRHRRHTVTYKQTYRPKDKNTDRQTDKRCQVRQTSEKITKGQLKFFGCLKS